MVSKKMQETYERIHVDDEWEPIRLQPNAFSTTRYDDVARLLMCAEGGSLLEVGCGGGRLTIALAEKFDKLVGLDISSVRLAAAQRELEHHPELAGKVQFKRGDLNKELPFDDAAFDCVVACALIEHVEDIFALMDEVARVCKIGGCTVISVPNICYLKHIWALLVGRLPLTGALNRDISCWRDHGWDGGHLHYFNRKSLNDMLHNVGFMPKEWSACGRWAKLRQWYTGLWSVITVRAIRIRKE